MAKYNFKFGKYWLSEFGAVSAEEPTIEIAQRDVTFMTVPGKDGKDCVDNGSYDNVEFKRKIAFVGCRDIKVKEKETQLINSFTYMQGYQDFEDTDHNGTEATYDSLLERWDKLVIGEARVTVADVIINRKRYVK